MNPAHIGNLAGKLALRACGHSGPSATAPPAVAGYAYALASAVEGCAVAATAKDATDWTGAPSETIAAAINDLASFGLIPGAPGSQTATGYLFRQGGAPVGRPSARGRREMARAAGYAVHSVAVGTADTLALTEDGDVASLTLDPDARPAAWGDLRGVVVHLDDLATGARRSLWIAKSELASRKAKSKGSMTSWDTDAVGMACSKAVSILVSRGAIPQASLLPRLLGPCGTAAPLTIEAQPAPRQIAETPASPPAVEPELPTEPDDDGPEHADEAADPDPSEPAPDPAEPQPLPADLAADLAADAESSRDHAEQAIAAAVDALRAAGKPHGEDYLRSPPVWSRLIQRAAALARAAEGA